MLTGLRILLAEDNSLNQKIANFMLAKNGVEVVTVGNGIEVINELEKNEYDLVLMDVQMPEMDGLEATEHIRKVMKNNIPIVALSASNFEDELKKCLAFGMNAYIVKPIDIVKLSDIIDTLSKENKINTRSTL
ncbi:MAG: response regulator [Chitinophagaceae bacterium]|nr:response regulator [Chitinophagaceae bacterium]